MTEEQALQKMWEDIQLRNLAKSTYKNYTRNLKEFLAFCKARTCVHTPSVPVQRLPLMRKYLVHPAGENHSRCVFSGYRSSSHRI